VGLARRSVQQVSIRSSRGKRDRRFQSRGHKKKKEGGESETMGKGHEIITISPGAKQKRNEERKMWGRRLVAEGRSNFNKSYMKSWKGQDEKVWKKLPSGGKKEKNPATGMR